MREKSRACGTKRGYTSKRITKKYIKQARKNGVRLIAYDCPHCDFWHLATKKRRNTKGATGNAGIVLKGKNRVRGFNVTASTNFCGVSLKF